LPLRAIVLIGFLMFLRIVWKLWNYAALREVATLTLSLALAAVTLGTCVVIVAGFSQNPVFVDNASSKSLDVFCDGNLWINCPPGSRFDAALRQGTYELVVLDADIGVELDRRIVKIGERGSAYVYNLLGAETYHRETIHYSQHVMFFSGKPQIEVIRDIWFEPKVDYCFQNAPQQIQSNSGTDRRTTLSRAPNERDKR
jgi:hypothetical protein